MIYGIDCDNTIFDVLTPTLEEYNSRYGTNYVFSDITDYHAHRVLNISKNTFYELLDFVWVNCWIEIQPFEPNISKIIKRLRRKGKNKIVLVTKRNLSTIINVINLIKKWKIIIDGIVCINGMDKTIVNIDYMIDDSKEITDMFGDRGLLLKRPYNKTWDIESIEDFSNKVKRGEISCR